MHLDFVSLLPEMFGPVLATGVIGRAAEDARFTWRAVPVRAFAHGRHRVTDEPPFGGGPGMVMTPGPLTAAIRWATHAAAPVPAPPADAVAFPAPPARTRRTGQRVVLLDAAGVPFTQRLAEQLALEDHLVLVCGRYEGVDERVRAEVDLCVGVGDAVLTGGELPALMVADAVVRLLPGTLGNADSVREESHAPDGLLEYPHYTRPRVFEGVAVPEVLLSGHHARVAKWRRQQSLLRTRTLRPEHFAALPLTPADRLLLDEADGKPPPGKKRKKR